MPDRFSDKAGQLSIFGSGIQRPTLNAQRPTLNEEERESLNR
jgi:hypothetical protein